MKFENIKEQLHTWMDHINADISLAKRLKQNAGNNNSNSENFNNMLHDYEERKREIRYLLKMIELRQKRFEKRKQLLGL